MAEPTNPRARFKPRSTRRIRYYKASLVLAFVFIAAALSFPLWIDYARRSSDRSVLAVDLDSVPAAAPAPAPPPAQKPAARPGMPGPAGNGTCRAYVESRCNTLLIPPGPCRSIADAGAAAPADATMADCRRLVEADLDQAARAFAGRAEPAAAPQASPEQATVPGRSQAAGATPVPAQAQGAPTVTATPGRDAAAAKNPAKAPDPAERAADLRRVRELVEEVQRAKSSGYYGTTPAAMRARYEELRNLVERDGSPELRRLYEDVTRPPAPAPTDSRGPLPSVSGSPMYQVGEAPRSPESEALDRMIDRTGGAPSSATTASPSAIAPIEAGASASSPSIVGSTAPAAATAQPLSPAGQ